MRVLRWNFYAIEDMRQIVEYCRETFGEKVARETRNKLRDDARLLTTQPFIGYAEQELAQPGIEIRSLLSGITKIVYSVHEKHIYIYALWNTRRDPNVFVRETKLRF